MARGGRSRSRSGDQRRRRAKKPAEMPICPPSSEPSPAPGLGARVDLPRVGPRRGGGGCGGRGLLYRRPGGFRGRAVGIIPARFASSRFEGKPLAPILGKPMIQVGPDSRPTAYATRLICAFASRVETGSESASGKLVLRNSSEEMESVMKTREMSSIRVFSLRFAAAAAVPVASSSSGCNFTTVVGSSSSSSDLLSFQLDSIIGNCSFRYVRHGRTRQDLRYSSTC